MAGLRVLQIVPSVSLVYGGPSQMVRGFSRALGQTGAIVTLLTTDANGDTGQAPLDVPLGQPVAEDYYIIRYFRCSPFRRYKFSLGLLAWLQSHGQEYDIAHIHALFSPISTAAATLARHQGLPYIMRPLGTLDPADLQKKRRLKQWYGALLEKPNLAGAAAIHFTSPMEAQVSQRFGTTTPDLVMPLGVEPQPSLSEATRQAILADLGIPQDPPLLLYLSRLEPKKGLDLLVPALEQLLAEAIPFHFVLAGSTPQNRAYEQRICDRITRSPLHRRTTRTGFVQGPTKAALLQSADGFVLPSRYENFGIAVAEAMLAGVPVIISKGVYIWQAVADSDSGWVCELTVDSLTTALREALTHPDLRHTRGNNAQTFAAEHYSWDGIARQTLKAYERLLTLKTAKG